MRQVLSFAKWLVIFLVIIGLAFFIYVVVKIDEPLRTSAASQTFTVTPGATTGQIAQNLQIQGFINKALFFKIYVKFKKQGKKIQAGKYTLSSAMSISEIADYLAKGKVTTDVAKFTIIEGWNLQEIGTALEVAGIMPKKIFLNVAGASGSDFSGEFAILRERPRGVSLEGFLFPDTYFISRDTKPEDVMRKMLSNFEHKVGPDLLAKNQNAGKKFYDTLILASIVEKEVGRNVRKGEKLSDNEIEKLSEERRLVASVFYNRLQIGKGLESDATVTYITGSKSPRPTLEETKIDSSYNTYRHRGLPPGPIANPSLDAIRAAIEPAKTDYLFFLTAPDGTAYFAKTLEEHKANRVKYLK